MGDRNLARVNLIFDVEIEKFRAEVLFACGEDKNRACFFAVSNNRASENNNLKHHFQFFRIDFS
jgi:hypothetical protein